MDSWPFYFHVNLQLKQAPFGGERVLWSTFSAVISDNTKTTKCSWQALLSFTFSPYNVIKKQTVPVVDNVLLTYSDAICYVKSGISSELLRSSII